jgi:hypothetical protein
MHVLFELQKSIMHLGTDSNVDVFAYISRELN